MKIWLILDEISRLSIILLLMTQLSGCKSGSERIYQNGRTSPDNPTDETITNETTDPENQVPEEQVDPELFFNEIVVASFKRENCDNCHAAGPGPNTIYDYKLMKQRLNNDILISKINISSNHGGNDVCLSGINDSPCSEIAQWWEYEFGAIPTRAGQRPLPDLGAIDAVSLSGLATGFAINPRDLTQTMTVTAYMNGDEDTGQALTPVQANVDAADQKNPGSHAYTLQVPPQYLDGEVQNIYLYAVQGNERNLLPGAPFSFRAWSLGSAGEPAFDYFENTVKPGLQLRCMGCHANVTYEYNWNRLLKPNTPAAGGTDTTNSMVAKGSGAVSHVGGNACGTTTLCADLAEWWRLEFSI